MPGYSLRRRARRDTSEAAIKAVLEAAGWTVQPLSLRDGPDLLVGAYGWFTGLAEIKTARGKVKPGQAHWHTAWRGVPVRVLRTPEEAQAWVRDVADAPQMLSDAQRLYASKDCPANHGVQCCGYPAVCRAALDEAHVVTTAARAVRSK